MSATTANFPTLAQSLWERDRSLLRNAVLVIGGSLALWVSAKIQIPSYPVPVNLQTFAVLVIGMSYGWRLAGAALLLYLAEGAMGLPVFSGTPERGIGLAYLTGPTGGYLAGQLLAAVTVGWLAQRGWDRRASSAALGMVLGNVIIYACGLLWLGAVLGWDKPILSLGLAPFLIGDAAKIVLAAVMLPLVWRLIGRRS